MARYSRASPVPFVQLRLDHPRFPGRLLWIGHRWSPAGSCSHGP
jgi:hypothetical protein